MPLAGCGDDSSTTDDGGVDEIAADVDADADAGVETDDGDVSGMVTVLVSFVDWPGDPVPAAGVVVAFDAPDGARSEGSTGSDGRVVFDVEDWSAGTAAATAFAAGRQMVSRVGITEGDDEIELRLNRLGDPAGFVRLSGTATNMPYADATLGVGASVDSVLYFHTIMTPGADWVVPVPSGSPCTLLATARTQFAVPGGRGFDGTMNWAMVEVPAVTSDTVVSLDFVDDAVPPTTVHGSFPFPTRTGTPLRGSRSYGWVWNTTKESRMSAYLGDTIRIAATADGTALDYDAHYIVPPDAISPLTCYFVLSDGDAKFQSATCEDGWPLAGPHDPGFLDAPNLLTTGMAYSPHTLSEPVRWELFDSGVHVAFLLQEELTYDRFILFGVNGAVKAPTPWIVFAPDDATTLTVPEPPSTTTGTAVLGTGRPIGFLQIWREGTDGIEYEKIALSQTIFIAP
jgi:hypothetical protein